MDIIFARQLAAKTMRTDGSFIHCPSACRIRSVTSGIFVKYSVPQRIVGSSMERSLTRATATVVTSRSHCYPTPTT
jgi:hypothetical protein